MIAASNDLSVEFRDETLHALWRADMVPRGWTAELIVRDSRGQAPSGLTIVYEGTSATATGDALTEGALLHVTLALHAPTSLAVDVTIHRLAAPERPLVDNHAGGISVAWPKVHGATDYRFALFDSGGAPIAPLPPIGRPEGTDAPAAWIDAATLTDGSQYGVRVAAMSDGSVGAWSEMATLILDRRAPDSKRLRALKSRLIEKGATVKLDAAMIGDPEIAALFARLSLADTEDLDFIQVDVSSDNDSVKLVGDTTLLKRPVKATAIFRDAEKFSLTLSGLLGAMTLSDLDAAKLIPGSVWPVEDWSAGLAGFGALELHFFSATAKIAVRGSEASGPWNPFDMPSITLAPVVPDLAIWINDAGQRRYSPRFTSQLVLGTTTVDIALLAPRGIRGWQMKLAAADGVAVNAFSDFGILFGRGGSALPDDVVAMGRFHLPALSILREPGSKVCSVSFTVSPEKVDGKERAWVMIDDRLVVDTLRARLDWQVIIGPEGRFAANPHGILSGRIKIGEAAVDAMIDLPVGSDGWRLATAAPVQLARLDALNRLAGGDAHPVMGEVAALGQIGPQPELVLEHAELRVRPTPPSIEATRFMIAAKQFSIPGLGWLKIDSAELDLAITRPFAAERAVAIGAGVSARIGEAFAVEGRIDKTADTLSGTITASTDAPPITAATLGEVLSPQDFAKTAPAPLGTGFWLRELGFIHDLGEARLRRVTLDMTAKLDWELIQGALTIEDVAVSAELTRAPGAADWQISARLAGHVLISDARLQAAAVKSDDGWRLALALEDENVLSFTRLVNELARGTTVVLPPDLPDVRLDYLRATLDCQTLETEAQLSTSVNWTPQLAAAQAVVSQLWLSLDLGPRQAEATRRYSLLVGGSLSLGNGITFAATARTGSGETKSELLATVTADSRTIRATDVAARLANSDTPLAQVAVPADFKWPSLIGAGLYADFTSRSVIVFGAADHLGVAALIVRRTASGEEAKYGAALLLQLASDFRFVTLVSEASPARPRLEQIDKALKIVEASLTVSSYATAAGDDPFVAMAQLQQAVPGRAMDIPRTPAVPQLTRGLNLVAKLVLTPGFWQGLGYVLDMKDGTTIAVTALIDADAPEKTEFSGELRNLPVANVLIMDLIKLRYRPKAAEILALECKGTLTVPTRKAPVQDLVMADEPDRTVLMFGGTLTVTKAGADAAFSAGVQTLRSPLGLSGLTFAGLAVLVSYRFAERPDGGTDRRLAQLELRGTAQLAGTALTARLLFADAKPKVAMVELGEQVAFDALFNQVIGRPLKPEEKLPAISLRKGRLYYAVSDLELTDEGRYLQGFHLDTTFRLLGYDFGLSASLTEKDGLSGDAHLPQAIDAKLAMLTAASDRNAGPGIGLTILDKDFKFGVRFGFVLFGLWFSDCALHYVTSGDEPIFEGTATYRGKTPFGENPKVTVRWSEKKGFEVVDWPDAVSGVFANIQDALKVAGDKDPCRALGDVIVDKLLKGDCEFSFSMAYDDALDRARVTIGVGYVVSANIAGEWVKLNPDPPKTELVFSVDMRNQPEKQFQDKLEDFARDTVVETMHSIINHPKASVQLAIALLAAPLATRAINALICRGTKEKKLEEEYKKRNEPDESGEPREDPKDPGSEALKQVNNATSEIGAAGSLAAATALFAAADVAAVAGAGFLTALLAGIALLFPPDSSPWKWAAARKKALDDARDRMKDALRKHLVIADLGGRYMGEGELLVSWRKLDGVAAYTLVAEIGGSRVTHETDQGSLRLDDPAIQPGAAVMLTMTAQAQGISGAPASVTVTIPDHRATGLWAEQVEHMIDLHWQLGRDPVAQWHVEALDSEGGGEPVRMIVNGHSTACSFDNLPTGRTYLLSVKPLDLPAPRIEPVRIKLSSLASPQEPHTRYDVDALTIDIGWTPVAGARGARAVLEVAGQPRSVDVGVTPPVARFDAVPPDGSPRYRLATLDDNATIWSVWRAADLAVPERPTLLSFAYDAGDLVVTWDSVAGATAYRVLVDLPADPARPPIEGEVLAEGGHWTARVAGDFADGEVWRARVRALGAAGIGPSTLDEGIARLIIHRLRTPDAEVVLDTERQSIALAIAAVPAASSYEVVLADAVGNVLARQESASAGDIRFDVAPFTGEVVVRLRAIAERCAGGWAATPPLALAGPLAPNGLVVSMDDQQVTIRFDAVAGATLYEAEILDATGKAVPGLNIRGIASPLAIPATQLPGTADQWQVRVRTLLSATPHPEEPA